MNFLLLGATGYLGRAFISSRSSADRVYCLSRGGVTISSAAELVHLSVDAADPNSVSAALEELESNGSSQRIDCIVNLAVSRLHREFPKTALDMFWVNCGVQAALIDFAYRCEIPQMVLGSTGSVYNNAWGDRAHEQDFVHPKSYFAATKMFADVLSSYYQNFLKIAILRFYVPYGPGLEGRMLNTLIERVQTEQPILIGKDGRSLVFSPIYVDDVALIIERAIIEQWQGIYNVGNGEVISLVEAAKLIAKNLGSSVKFSKILEGEPPYLVPDCGQLRTKMPDHEFVNFDFGLRSMIFTAS